MGAVPKHFDRNSYETPPWFFRALDKEFHFTWDLCAVKKTSKCKKFFSPKDDAFKRDWFLIDGWLWINPPYNPLKPWLERIQAEADLGAKIVCLAPPIVTTGYFAKRLPTEIRFITGRMSFLADGVPCDGNRDASCLLIFNGIQSSARPKVTWVSRDELYAKGSK